jgi:hypothetical protein
MSAAKPWWTDMTPIELTEGIPSLQVHTRTLPNLDEREGFLYALGYLIRDRGAAIYAVLGKDLPHRALIDKITDEDRATLVRFLSEKPEGDVVDLSAFPVPPGCKPDGDGCGFVSAGIGFQCNEGAACGRYLHPGDPGFDGVKQWDKQHNRVVQPKPGDRVYCTQCGVMELRWPDGIPGKSNPEPHDMEGCSCGYCGVGPMRPR